MNAAREKLNGFQQSEGALPAPRGVGELTDAATGLAVGRRSR